MPQLIEGHKHGRVPREIRAIQLLDVAEHQFSIQGYQGTSIDSIADAAGVTRPMVYNIFGSKDGIYIDCLRRARGVLEAAILEAFSGTDGLRSKLARGFDAYLKFLEDQPSAWSLLYGGGAAVTGPAAKEVLDLRFATVNVIASLLRRELGKDIPDKNLLITSHAISGGAEQAAKWWRENPKVKRMDVVNQLVATYHTGLAAQDSAG